MQISRIDSERITILRALALTSVVSAHTASVVLKDKGTVFCSDLLSACLLYTSGSGTSERRQGICKRSVFC